MIDLTTIPADTRLARGDYATVRAAHEDAKKRLSKLAGELQSIAGRVLRRMQPDNDEVPESVAELFLAARSILDKMDECADQIESLARQRRDLKASAWGHP